METSHNKQPGLLTAIGIGVGCIIGSGWLFSAYYAAQYIGPASFFSWSIGAIFSLILALLLAEIAGMFKQKALFSRLLTISHNNPDFGFVIAISGWLGLVIVIPTEASATVQYLSTIIPSYTHYLFVNEQHTLLGKACIIFLVMIYSIINYWGIQSLAKVSNFIAVFKIIIPILTALILLSASFHPENFSSQGFAPYGYERIFSGVVVCGIFYAFYGFAMIAMYSRELKNPRKNIPRALIISVLLCFIIYVLLQAAFIGGLPPSMVAKGWKNLSFTSPLAQLLILLHINILSLWSMVLYFDSAISPSGTAIIYLGSAGRTLTGMSRDKQFPGFFNKIHPVFQLSRRSLLFTALTCSVILFFFKNWKELMILVSVFQLISCAAIPVAFTKLRLNQPDKERIYRVKLGKILSYFIFLVVTYLLAQANVASVVVAAALHVFFFLVYAIIYYKRELKKILTAYRSANSIFIYMFLAIGFSYLHQEGLLIKPPVLMFFVVIVSTNFWMLIQQKNFMPQEEL